MFSSRRSYVMKCLMQFVISTSQEPRDIYVAIDPHRLNDALPWQPRASCCN